MRSLTRAEAEDRAATVRVTGYDIDLDLREDGPTFRSRSTVRFGARPGSRTFVEVRPRRLRSVRLNGRSLDPVLEDGRLVLDCLDESNALVVDADMAYSHEVEGLCRTVDPADGQSYLYAMSFLDAAPRWFACLDQPDLKAPVSLTVHAPREWTVAGNAPALATGAGEWRLEQPNPLATYVTTLIAGPYATVAESRSGVRFALHARASLRRELERDADSLLRDSAGFLAEFERMFAFPYPWGEYHQAFVPELGTSAMENPGCVTIGDDLLFRGAPTDAEIDNRANTIAHEMAHMWFGDLVTMRWWDDLWLNESFAEYLGFVACEALGRRAAWTEFGISTKPWGQRADRRPSTHPVAANAAGDTAAALTDFDGISYAKGAALLRQLATRLGAEAFGAGLRRHIAAHAFGNATLADLLAAWTAASGVDITAWSDAWLRTSGMDTLQWRDGAVLRHSPDGSHREHAVTLASFARDGSLREAVPLVLDGNRTPAAISPGALVLPDARDETWAKIALPDTAWQDVPELLPRLRGPERLAIWNALRLALADSELDPRLAAQIVVATLPVEEDDAVLGAVGTWAVSSLAAAYLSETERPAALTALAAAADAAVYGAPAGSGRALAAARLYVSATSDGGALRRWLDGDVPHGLVLDVDLRWAVVLQLCALGEFSAEELGAEAARDRTAQGELRAAQADAARPEPAAKERAWQTLMSDPDAPNPLLYAIARGFWQPGQAATEPYAARFFEEVPGMAQLRSGWVLSRLAELSYPRTAVRRATVAASENLLRREDLHPGIRRGVVDAGDDLRRAVEARERFGVALS